MMLVRMAGCAGQRRILEQRRAMAFFARHDGVAPDQRKSRDVMIEERGSAPARLPVTLPTPTAQLTFVRIILPVARHAGRRQPVAIEIAGMARIALDLGMRGAQRKFRRLVMIEANRGPLVLIVAAFALGAVAPGMDILNLVAGRACNAGALVAFLHVTRDAGHDTMCTLETEPGLVVVERLDAAPARFGMTIIAGLAQTSLMRIAGLVTVEAASGRLSELHGMDVAVDALRRLMGSRGAGNSSRRD